MGMHSHWAFWAWKVGLQWSYAVCFADGLSEKDGWSPKKVMKRATLLSEHGKDGTTDPSRIHRFGPRHSGRTDSHARPSRLAMHHCPLSIVVCPMLQPGRSAVAPDAIRLSAGSTASRLRRILGERSGGRYGRSRQPIRDSGQGLHYGVYSAAQTGEV